MDACAPQGTPNQLVEDLIYPCWQHISGFEADNYISTVFVLARKKLRLSFYKKYAVKHDFWAMWLAIRYFEFFPWEISALVFAVKLRKHCEISVKVVKTCLSKLASANLRPAIGLTGRIILRCPLWALRVPMLSVLLNLLVRLDYASASSKG